MVFLYQEDGSLCLVQVQQVVECRALVDKRKVGVRLQGEQNRAFYNGVPRPDVAQDNLNLNFDKGVWLRVLLGDSRRRIAGAAECSRRIVVGVVCSLRTAVVVECSLRTAVVEEGTHLIVGVVECSRPIAVEGKSIEVVAVIQVLESARGEPREPHVLPGAEEQPLSSPQAAPFSLLVREGPLERQELGALLFLLRVQRLLEFPSLQI